MLFSVHRQWFNKSWGKNSIEGQGTYFEERINSGMLSFEILVLNVSLDIKTSPYIMRSDMVDDRLIIIDIGTETARLVQNLNFLRFKPTNPYPH